MIWLLGRMTLRLNDMATRKNDSKTIWLLGRMTLRLNDMATRKNDSKT